MTLTNNELSELENFNFTNMMPSESTESKCIQMSQRIKLNFKHTDMNIKSNYFVSKHFNEYKVIGIIVHESESLVFYSADKYLLIALKNVESGLRNQIQQSSTENRLAFKKAV